MTETKTRLWRGSVALLALVTMGAAGCASTPPPPPAPEPAVPAPAVPTPPPEIRYVEATSLNVHRTPGEDGVTVGSLPQWQRVRVLERDGSGWVRIEAGDDALDGWVAERYLAEKSPWEPLPPQQGDVPISASVEFNDFQFTFHNLNDFDWVDATIYVNPGSPAETYTYRVDVIAAGSAKNLGAWRFRNAAGETLDPQRVHFDEIEISCRTPRGRGYWSAHGKP
jgi:hypothetical protein